MSAPIPVAVRRVEWRPGLPAHDLELGAPQAGGTYAHALVLLEHDGVPWGVVGVAATDGVLRGATIATAAAAQSSGTPWSAMRAPGDGGGTDALRLRVVITASGDPWRVVRAVAALVRTEDPALEVTVVADDTTLPAVGRMLEDAFPAEPRLAWRATSGSSRAAARNAGAEGAESGVVAFLDDEVVVHPYWTAVVRAALGDAERDGIGVGIGRVLPLALETEAQWLRFRASASGREPASVARLDRPAIWAAAGDHVPAAAVEGGLCVTAAAFWGLGGFDVRLGAGLPSASSDEVDLILRARRAGYSVRDMPRAISFREYPAATQGIMRDAFTRGAGVSATMTKQLVAGPGALGRVKGASAALRVGHAARLRSAPDVALASGSPRRLVVIERLGLVAGPAAYLRSAIRGRGVAR